MKRIGVICLGMIMLLTSCSNHADQLLAEKPSASQLREFDSDHPDVDETKMAQEQLERFLTAFESLKSYDARSVISNERITQTIQIRASYIEESFKGSVEINLSPDESFDIEILRTEGFTWIKAPPEYWRMNGYATAGPHSDGTKYVVFSKEVGDAVADPYNYGQLLKMTAATPKAEFQLRESGNSSEFSYTVGHQPGAPVLNLPKNGEVESFKMKSTVSGLSASIEFDLLGEVVNLKMPSPNDVVQE